MRMSVAPGIGSTTIRHPGRASWNRTTPESSSAMTTIDMPVTVSGAVEPICGMDTRQIVAPFATRSRLASVTSGSCCSGATEQCRNE